MTVQCARCTGGNSLCELLAPEEAPETVPDLDIFPKARRESPCVVDEIWQAYAHSVKKTYTSTPTCQLQLEQIPEEDEEMEVGVPQLQGKCLSKYQAIKTEIIWKAREATSTVAAMPPVAHIAWSK